MSQKSEHIAERLFYTESLFHDFLGKHFTSEPGCIHRVRFVYLFNDS